MPGRQYRRPRERTGPPVEIEFQQPGAQQQPPPDPQFAAPPLQPEPITPATYLQGMYHRQMAIVIGIVALFICGAVVGCWALGHAKQARLHGVPCNDGEALAIIAIGLHLLIMVAGYITICAPGLLMLLGLIAATHGTKPTP